MKTQELDPNAITNPSSGIIARNPTRLNITDKARDQQAIVKAIKGANQKIGTLILNYHDIDKSDPPPHHGVLKIREMEEKELKGFFRSLMRSRPNIIRMQLKLGEYKTKRRINNNKTSDLSSDVPRLHTEVAEKIAEVFDDHRENIVEVIYTVNNADPSYFNVSAEVYAADDVEYKDDKLFAPAIGIEYLQPN